MSIKQFLHHLNRRDTRIIPQIKLSRYSRIFLVFLLLFSAVYFARVIRAQNIIEQVQTAQSKGNNAESWHKNALESNSVTMLNSLVGNITIKDGKPQLQGFVPKGAIGYANNMIASLYNPPASGIEYIAQVKDQFFGGKAAYAQGATGFTGLQPILALWRGFRNVVYILSAVVFVIIGLMIMLRVKISPQAVITIQSAIPQIITTLILVTFSYAIAGLLIDAMYFFQTIVLVLLFNTKGLHLSDTLIDGWLPSTQYNFASLQSVGFWGFFNLIYKVLPMGTVFLLSGIIGGTIGGIMGGISGSIVPLAGNALGVAIGATLGTVILFVAFLLIIIINLVKLFFALGKCYLQVILKIIFAPLEIGLGAIPNMKMGFSTWLIDLIAHLAVFPIVLIFLVLVNIICQDYSSALWAPSIISGFTWIIPAAIGFSTLLLLPQLPELIPQAIFQLKPSPFGNAIAQGYKTMPGKATMDMVTGDVKYAALGATGDYLGDTFGINAARNVGQRRANRPAPTGIPQPN